MSQSAPLHWFFCFLVFSVILWRVGGKLWFSGLRPRFLFPRPCVPARKAWRWG